MRVRMSALARRRLKPSMAHTRRGAQRERPQPLVAARGIAPWISRHLPSRTAQRRRRVEAQVLERQHPTKSFDPLRRLPPPPPGLAPGRHCLTPSVHLRQRCASSLGCLPSTGTRSRATTMPTLMHSRNCAAEWLMLHRRQRMVESQSTHQLAWILQQRLGTTREQVGRGRR